MFCDKDNLPLETEVAQESKTLVDNIEVWKVRLWHCAFLIHFKGYDYFKDYSASKIFKCSNLIVKWVGLNHKFYNHCNSHFIEFLLHFGLQAFLILLLNGKFFKYEFYIKKIIAKAYFFTFLSTWLDWFFADNMYLASLLRT
jgi:hypothetical protein